MALLLGLCLGGIAAQALAQAPTTTYRTDVELTMQRAGLGAEFGDDVALLVNLLRVRQFDQAEPLVPKTCGRYEALFEPGQRYLAFANDEERAAYSASDPQPFRWVHFSYALCLKAALFIAVERGRDADALRLAERLTTLSPVSAGAQVELGFLLNRLRRYDESLQAYQRAQGLAQQHVSQRAFLAMALRGLGSSQIDLGQWDAAEVSYRQSQRIEPDSPVARHQLAHIQSQRPK